MDGLVIFKAHSTQGEGLGSKDIWYSMILGKHICASSKDFCFWNITSYFIMLVFTYVRQVFWTHFLGIYTTHILPNRIWMQHEKKFWKSFENFLKFVFEKYWFKFILQVYFYHNFGQKLIKIAGIISLFQKGFTTK